MKILDMKKENNNDWNPDSSLSDSEEADFEVQCIGSVSSDSCGSDSESYVVTLWNLSSG